MNLRIVTRGNEFDDVGDVTGGTEVTGNGDENISTLTGRGEDFLVNSESAREILGLEAGARGSEAWEDVAGGGSGGCLLDGRWSGRRSGLGRNRRGLRRSLFASKAVEKSHAGRKTGDRRVATRNQST